MSHAKWTRREILAMTPGLSAIALGGRAVGQTINKDFTPSLVLGPFYPQMKPFDQDADLTVVKGRKGVAEGTVIHVAGRVMNADGKPISQAKIEIWQANARGRYAHPSDPNPAALDADFQGYCAIRTDQLGRYRFKTIMPGPYPGMRSGMRTPHIHFDIQAKSDRLVTQMFFPGEKLNETDSILNNVRSESARAALVAKVLEPAPDIPRNQMLFGWDIVMLNG